MATIAARLAAVAIVASVVALITACQAAPVDPSPTSAPTGAATATPVPPTATASPVSPAATASPTPGASPTPPPTRPPATMAPTPTATPTARPTDPPAGPVWTYLADFPAGEAIDVSAVAHIDGRFVAAGSEPAEGQPIFGLRQGVIWTSDDGMTWQRTDDEAFANATLLHVAAVGDVTYVFGVRSICLLAEEECLDLPDAGMTVWRNDGDGWVRLAQSPSMREAFLAGVVVVDETIVAYGDRPSRGGDFLVAAAWSSDDGEEWQEVTRLAGLDPISAATVGPDGLVAFGTRLIPGTDRIETVAAFSADGVEYEPVILPAGMDAVIESVTYGEAGFVAAGAAEDAQFMNRNPTILVSDDGRFWTEARLDDSFAGAALHQVRALEDGYVLLGSRPSVADFERDSGLSWTSDDGRTWAAEAPLTGGDYRLFNGTAVGPEGVVVFALDFEEEVLEGPLSTIRGWFAPVERLLPESTPDS